MASLQERLKDNEYKLWIKDGLCLNLTKKGIETFANERSKKTHTFVKSAVEKQAVNTTSDGVQVAMNNICGNAKIVAVKKSGWSLGCCTDCDIYVKEILKLCKQQGPGQPRFKPDMSNWVNSDVQKWPTEHWEIAKVYMNKGQKAFQKTPTDTDLSGLLNFIDHCNVPWVDIQNKDNIKKVRDARNEVMHSASVKMTDAEFLSHTTAMEDLLLDSLFMDKLQEAQDAAKEIQKIVQSDIIITSTDELKVLTAKTSSLQEQNDRLQEEVDTLKSKYTKLESSGDLRDKALRSLIETETGQREDDIAKLKTEIAEKESRMKELSTELSLVKKLIHQDRDLYRKMDIRVNHVETTLDKTATEVREIKQSHYALVDNVQRIQAEMKRSGADIKDVEQGHTELGELKEENYNLKASLQEKDKELEETRVKNKELEKQISAVTKSSKEKEDNSKLLAAENANKLLVEKNENLSEQNKQLQNELRKSKENDLSTECKNKTCRSTIEALEYEKKMLKEESNRDLAATCHDLENQNIVLEAKMTFSTKETDRLNSIIEEQKLDLHKRQNKIQELNTAITKTTSEKIEQQDRHMREKAAFQNRIKSLELDISVKDTELSDRNEQIVNLVQEQERLNKDKELQSRTHKTEKEKWENQIKTLQHDKTTKETALNKEIQNIFLENENLKKDLQSNTEISSKAEITIDSLNADKTQLQNELTKKEEECESLKEENTSLKTKETKQSLTRDTDVIHATPVNVWLPDDESTPWISGAEFTSTGDLVICDGKNKRITVLDQSFAIKRTARLQWQPWDVSEIDSNTIVVTMPYVKQIKIIEMQPALQEKKTNYVDMMCWGVNVYKGEIYATHLNRLGEGGVVILDFEGKLKRRINVNDLHGSIVFINPENIAVNRFGVEAMAISDNDSNFVTIVDVDRTLYCQYNDSDLKSPGGICFDKRSNVIVCGSGSNNLQIVSLFGEKLKTIATPKNPMSVAYRENDDTIIVGFDTDFLLVIDLKHFFKD